MIRKLAQALDKIANDLEEKGFIKEAYEIDIVSNTINASILGDKDIDKGIIKRIGIHGWEEGTKGLPDEDKIDLLSDEGSYEEIKGIIEKKIRFEGWDEATAGIPPMFKRKLIAEKDIRPALLESIKLKGFETTTGLPSDFANKLLKELEKKLESSSIEKAAAIGINREWDAFLLKDEENNKYLNDQNTTNPRWFTNKDNAYFFSTIDSVKDSAKKLSKDKVFTIMKARIYRKPVANSSGWVDGNYSEDVVKSEEKVGTVIGGGQFYNTDNPQIQKFLKKYNK